MTTLTRQLSYAKGEEIVALLKSANVLSPRGTAYVDARTNTLILTDLADRLQTSTQLINTLDTAQPQVEIEARIVQTNKDYARALGVQWGFNGRVDPGLGNTTPLAFRTTATWADGTPGAPGSGGLQGQTGGTITTQVPTAVNMAVAGATSGIGPGVGIRQRCLESGRRAVGPRERGTRQAVVHSARDHAEQRGRGNRAGRAGTVSNHREQHRHGPVQGRGVDSPRDAADYGGQYRDHEHLGRQRFGGRSVSPAPPGQVPSINTQRANTQVLVSDGQTTVIGGIYVSTETTTTDRTPGLSRLPLLRWLFSATRSKTTAGSC
jgi:type IV pilus assembly protein PilQ